MHFFSHIQRNRTISHPLFLGGQPAHRQAALHAGIIPHLVEALNYGVFDVKREAALALRNVCAERDAIEAVLARDWQTVLTDLVGMLRSKDPEVTLACLQIISAIALFSTEVKAIIVERCQNFEICDALEELQVTIHFLLHRLYILLLANGILRILSILWKYGSAVPEEIRMAANTMIDELFEDPTEEFDDARIHALAQEGEHVFASGGGMGRGVHLTRPNWM